MNYVIADMHGCYEQYRKLLEKIHFSEEDILYVLGDVVDRGPEPIRLLTDLSMRANVYPVMGNHEYMALTCLKKLSVEITEENCDTLTKEDMISFMNWIKDGGQVTAEQFRKLSADEQEALIEYMEDMPLYEIAETEKGVFVLVHAGIHNFEPGKRLSDYSERDLLFSRNDYKKKYFEQATVVTGHTPTLSLSKKRPAEAVFFEESNQIAIDCGACFGGRLACLCLDTLEVFYE